MSLQKLMTDLKEWAMGNYGIAIQAHQEETIAQRINKVMQTWNLTPAGYFSELQRNQDIVCATIDAITIQETYFFRDASLFLYLKETLLPKLIHEKRIQQDLSLRIWCVGCASGEELYSIAICLHQLLPDLLRWKITLLGTDVNHVALKRAEEAVYRKSSLRATNNSIIKTYFTELSSLFHLCDDIRKLAEFKYSNIANMSAPFQSDLIFCRNVFIYLTPKIITNALTTFYESLRDEGILFLGPADLVTHYSHKFSLSMESNLILMTKKAKALPDVRNKSETELAYRFPDVQTQKEMIDELQQIDGLLQQRNYKEALKRVDDSLSQDDKSAIMHRFKGEALLGLGDVETAILSLKKSVTIDPLDATAYFLQALGAIDLKKNEEALQLLQKAVYVKPDYPEAIYRLALLHLKNKQQAFGIKLLKQSLTCAEKQNKEEAFIESIKNSIAYYQGRKHVG